MAVVECIPGQTRKSRRKQFQEGKDKGLAESLEHGAKWNERHLQAEECGERFDEPDDPQ